MTRISGRLPPVTVEYDCRGKRKQKRFECAYKAKQFFTLKWLQRKNPEVRKVKDG